MDASPLLRNLFNLSLWAAIVELGGSLIIAGYVAAAMVALVRRRGLPRVQGLVAQGALTGLSVEVAAALLKTIVVHTGEQLAVFAGVFALRTLFKWVFTWERERSLHTAE